MTIISSAILVNMSPCIPPPPPVSDELFLGPQHANSGGFAYLFALGKLEFGRMEELEGSICVDRCHLGGLRGRTC